MDKINHYEEGLYEEYEKVDENKFKMFSDHYPVMFHKYRSTEYGCPIDIISLTSSGGTYAIELKSRDKVYQKMYIELSKYTTLRKLKRTKGFLPLYICFVGNDVYMWVLSNVENVGLAQNLKIRMQKRDGYYEDDRLTLDINEAIHYKYDPETSKYTVIKPEERFYKTDIIPSFRPESILSEKITKKTLFEL